jgi:hypothetical protein
MKSFHYLVLMLASLMACGAANADDLLTGNTSIEFGTNVVDGRYIGQSFTTSSNVDGYTLGTIYLLDYLGTSRVGNGTLYLYSSLFTDNVSNLASGSGLLATVTYDSTNSCWVFSGVTLSANTTYYFYLDSTSEFQVGASTSNPYSGGQFYNCTSGGTSFTSISSADVAFGVTGTAVPEPAAVAGLAGLAALGFVAIKRRKA